MAFELDNVTHLENKGRKPLRQVLANVVHILLQGGNTLKHILDGAGTRTLHLYLGLSASLLSFHVGDASVQLGNSASRGLSRLVIRLRCRRNLRLLLVQCTQPNQSQPN